jgi:hypothetical protein
MSTDEELAGCQAARRWVSAHRDGEAFEDVEAARHLEACAACAAWVGALDGLTGRLRLRPATQPDLVGPALAAWQEGSAEQGYRRLAAGRALLWVAAVTGLTLAASRLVGIPPLSARISEHAGRELAALEAAVATGFMLAAWRPHRHVGGLLWVALTAAVLTLVGSGADVLAGRSDLGGEVAHLPLLAGALGLALIRLGRPQGELGVAQAPDGPPSTGPGKHSPPTPATGWPGR